MLEQKTIDVIKSTVPVLEEFGEAITTRFYTMMFDNHPELLNIFNHANQKQGRQQQALASAVYAAAANIDNLESILPVVNQIGEKHRSLGVKPEHYPIVGKHLLMAIQDVLGEAATPEIMGAWEKAYGVIADVFIQVENKMYDDAEKQAGGWSGFRNFTVAKKVKESDVITSFYLKPEDNEPIASFRPGQYISVQITIPGEDYTHIRQYSLSDAPGKDYYRISVKKETGIAGKPDGKVSTYLHENIHEGDVLPLSAPAGDFVLDETSNHPAVLISGGVGITPLMSMLNTLVQKEENHDITFVHAAQNGSMQAFTEHIDTIVNEHPHVRAFTCYEKPTESDRRNNSFAKEGYIDLAWLKQIVSSKDVNFYFCGPVPFMKTVKHALEDWNVPTEQIHFEFFGPAVELERDRESIQSS